MKKQQEHKALELGNTVLIIVFVAALVVLGILVYAVIPKACTHLFCDKVEHAPTCAGKGYTSYTCNSCGYQFEADFVAPLSHTYEKNTTAPTCETEGFDEQVCSVCGDNFRENYTAPVGHSYSERVSNPTCEGEGFTTYTCSVCEYSIVGNFVAPLGHKLSSREVDATCEEQGYTVHSCDRCSYSFASDYIEPLGHDERRYLTRPTCESEGYTTHICSRCDYSYVTDFVGATGHSYAKTYVRPNIAETGYTIYTCEKCGLERVSDYVFYTDIFTGSAGEGRGKASAWGLDLSHHSADVDFEALVDAGVDFVILRIGFNKTLDTKFEEYYAAARAAGLDIGVYFFTLSDSAEEAIADAERVASWLEGKKLEYPVFYDLEDYAQANFYPTRFTEQQIMDVTLSFMQTMVDLGYYPGIYTNSNMLYNIYNSEKALRLYDVWLARYPGEGVDPDDFVDENVDGYSQTYSMWQYMGDVYGFGGAISGACDINYAFKDYPEIIKKHGFNGY